MPSYIKFDFFMRIISWPSLKGKEIRPSIKKFRKILLSRRQTELYASTPHIHIRGLNMCFKTHKEFLKSFSYYENEERVNFFQELKKKTASTKKTQDIAGSNNYCCRIRITSWRILQFALISFCLRFQMLRLMKNLKLCWECRKNSY